MLVATIIVPLVKMADFKLTRNTLSVFIGTHSWVDFSAEIYTILSNSKRVCVIVYEIRLTLTSTSNVLLLPGNGCDS